MIIIYSVRILNIIEVIAKTSISKIAKCLTLPPTVLDSSFCQVHHLPQKMLVKKKSVRILILTKHTHIQPHISPIPSFLTTKKNPHSHSFHYITDLMVFFITPVFTYYYIRHTDTYRQHTHAPTYVKGLAQPPNCFFGCKLGNFAKPCQLSESRHLSGNQITERHRLRLVSVYCSILRP